MITVVRAVHEVGVTHPAASLIVDKFVDAGILTPMNPSAARNRLYLATEILDLPQGELPSTDRRRPLQQPLELA